MTGTSLPRKTIQLLSPPLDLYHTALRTLPQEDMHSLMKELTGMYDRLEIGYLQSLTRQNHRDIKSLQILVATTSWKVGPLILNIVM